uniref:Zinc finger protein 706 n=1 Tax=Hucho hucho TaxID=62062 RepID=A0A4W5P804_9TELE
MFKLKLSLTDTKAVAAKKKGAAADQKTAAKAALVHTCPVCRHRLLTSSILYLTFTDADPKTFKQHSESKHPTSPMLPVLVDVQA